MTTHCSSTNPQSLFSPSFTTHSSHRLEDVAARVIRELSNESNPDAEIDFNPICEEFWAENAELDSQQSRFQEELQSDGLIEEKEDSFQEELQRNGLFEEKEYEDEEQEFEFPLISRDWISCPVSKYPVFNTDLLLEAELITDRNYKEGEKLPVPEKVIRLPLRMLFEEEREKSEREELNGIPVGTYCVWKPKKVSDVEEGRRRWNNKSGLSKRWKWQELIHRISSDVGKGRFVFLAPVNGEDKKKEKKVEEKVEKSKMPAVSPEKLAEHGRDKRRWIWSGSFSKANGMSWS